MFADDLCAAQVHNILSLSECDHLIALAKRHGMQKALIQPYGESGLVESSTRTNTAAWLNFKVPRRCPPITLQPQNPKPGTVHPEFSTLHPKP